MRLRGLIHHVKPESKTRHVRTFRRRRPYDRFGPPSDLLELLAQTERSVDELAGLSGLTIANASQHLQQLRRMGLVQTRRDGKRVVYKLADAEVVALLGSLSRVTERNVGAAEKVLKSYFR